MNVSWLRSQIAIVSQEPILFDGSIEENIRFGKPDATDDQVERAARMANAHDFIINLPQVKHSIDDPRIFNLLPLLLCLLV